MNKWELSWDHVAAVGDLSDRIVSGPIEVGARLRVGASSNTRLELVQAANMLRRSILNIEYSGKDKSMLVKDQGA